MRSKKVVVINVVLEYEVRTSQFSLEESHTELSRQMATVLTTRNKATRQDLHILESWIKTLGPLKFNRWLSGTPGLPNFVSFALEVADLTLGLANSKFHEVLLQSLSGYPAGSEPLPFELDAVSLQPYSGSIHQNLACGDLMATLQSVHLSKKLLNHAAPILPKEIQEDILEVGKDLSTHSSALGLYEIDLRQFRQKYIPEREL